MKIETDMEQKKQGIRSSIRKVNSLVHTLMNIYDKASDDEFREFQIMEYSNLKHQEVNDIKRLTYLKKMQLAKNGRIDTDLKNLLAQQRQKQRLIDRDAKITPVGHLKVFDGEMLRAELQVGYEKEQQIFTVAYTDHESIPKWKILAMGEFVQFIARIHPNESDNLRLEHRYSESDLTYNQTTKDSKQLYKTYNQCVSEAFYSNKYFENSVLDPDENLVKNPEMYVGKQFRLRLPGKHTCITTLMEANGHYLSFRSFLEAAPKSETYYFTLGEFKRLFLDSQIEVIAHLKYNLLLGVKDGVLKIGRKLENPSQSALQWDSYNSIIKTSELPMITKYYLCKEVITNKNFVVEKDAVRLESQGKKAFLKKHYKTGKWHFAELRKSSDELHFRPLNTEVLRYIRQTYSESKNFGRIEEPVKENPKGKTTSQMRR